MVMLWQSITVLGKSQHLPSSSTGSSPSRLGDLGGPWLDGFHVISQVEVSDSRRVTEGLYISCLSFNVFGPFGHQVLAHLQRSRSANLITYGAVPGLFKSQVTIFGWLSHELFVVAIGCNLYTTHSSARGDPCLRTRSSLEVGNVVGEDLAAEIFGKQCVSTSYSNFHWRVWRRRSFVSYDCVRDFILGQAAQAMTNWASKYISRRACERTSEYEESLVSFWD